MNYEVRKYKRFLFISLKHAYLVCPYYTIVGTKPISRLEEPELKCKKIASLMKNTNGNLNTSARMLFTSRKSECSLPPQYIWGYIAKRQ